MTKMYDDYKSQKLPDGTSNDDILKDMHDRLSRLEFIVTGADGENGLRYNQKKMLSEMETIKRIIWIAIGGAVILQFVIPIILKN